MVADEVGTFNLKDLRELRRTDVHLIKSSARGNALALAMNEVVHDYHFVSPR
jgi:hypothetical protein